MRKIAVVLLLMVLLNLLVGCSQQKEVTPPMPEITQVRSICNLATLECYYHNVAKIEKEAGTGILHIGEVDRKLWIEYTGYVTVGIDVSKVTMTIEGEKVKVFIPKATVLDVGVHQDEERNTYESQDSIINANPITAEEQSEAMGKAEQTMRQMASQNKALLMASQNRAQQLIGNYITQLGRIANVEYEIEWEYESNESELVE